MSIETFALSLKDAEFVVEELPQHDDFTRALRAWCEEQRAVRDERREAAEQFDREVWNPFLWRIIGGIHGPELVASPKEGAE